MITKRLKHIRPVLIVVISLFIPVLMAYSLYGDLSGMLFLSSDMSFEDFGDEDSCTCETKLKVFIPTVSSNPSSSWRQFGRGPVLVSSPFTSSSQIAPVLRC
jgi:hypothetical protein